MPALVAVPLPFMPVLCPVPPAPPAAPLLMPLLPLLPLLPLPLLVPLLVPALLLVPCSDRGRRSRYRAIICANFAFSTASPASFCPHAVATASLATRRL